MPVSIDLGGRLVTLLDEVSDTLSYVGKADPGTATSASIWQIRRVDTSSGVTVYWAGGTNKFDKVWDNRASYSYS